MTFFQSYEMHVFIEQCLKVHNGLHNVQFKEVPHLILVIEIKTC